MSAITSSWKLGGFTQQKFTLSRFRRPEVRNQGVQALVASGGSKAQSAPCLYSSLSGCWQVLKTVPWLVAASLNLCLHSHLGFFPVCISACPLLLKGHQSLDLGSTLLQYDLILITFAETLFWGSGWTWIWRGHYSTHYSAQKHSWVNESYEVFFDLQVKAREEIKNEKQGRDYLQF